MKLRIECDGSIRHSKVVNADTGEELEYIRAIRWEADIGKNGGIAEVHLDLVNVQVDIAGEANPVLDMAKRWADATDYERCEVCDGPAEYHDADDVPLYELCAEAL